MALFLTDRPSENPRLSPRCFLEDFNKEVSIRGEWNGVVGRTAGYKSGNEGSLRSLGPAGRALAET